MESLEYVKGVSVKSIWIHLHRVKMRKAALLWRHACRHGQWETAEMALEIAVHARSCSQLFGGAL